MKIDLLLGTLMAILCLLIFGGQAANSNRELSTSENGLPATEGATPYPFPLDIFESQIVTDGDLQVELVPNEQFNDAILRVHRGENWFQEIFVSSITGIKNGSRPFATAKIIHLIDLDQNSELEIILVTTHQGAGGGSLLTYVIYYDERSRAYFFTSPGLDQINLIADQENYFLRPTFRGRDFSFFSKMIPTSASYFTPVQLLQFDGRELIDVTSNYPHIVADDAEYWLAHAENRIPHLSQAYIDGS